MRYDPSKHHRRSIRLKGYGYAQEGVYYVTIVAQDRRCLFGDVVDGEMQVNGAGEMLRSQWEALPQRFPNVELDGYIVMPNHLHWIVLITDKTRAGENKRARTTRAPTTRTRESDSVGAGLVPAQSDDKNNHDRRIHSQRAQSELGTVLSEIMAAQLLGAHRAR